MNQAQQELIDLFAKNKSWEDRYRLLLRRGKMLPFLAPELKSDEALLSGCESNVWFYGHYSAEQQMLELSIDSDAKIIKGLISIIATSFENLNYQQVQDFDCLLFIEQLGLLNHLSPSRGNGIRAIILAIKQLKKSINTC